MSSEWLLRALMCMNGSVEGIEMEIIKFSAGVSAVGT
jgi:hypothetical protein